MKKHLHLFFYVYALVLLTQATSFAECYQLCVNQHDSQLWCYEQNEWYHEGQLFVKVELIEGKPINLSTTVSKQKLLGALVQRYGIVAIKSAFQLPELSGIYVLSFTNIAQTQELIHHLEQLPFVVYAERVPKYHLLDCTPNDPLLAQQYSLNNTNAPTALGLLTANSCNFEAISCNQSVVMAMVDDAVLTTHEDIAPNLWVNIAEIPANGIDDDTNGYIDDINGWDSANNDNNPNPDVITDDHGTHCTGIAAAKTNNSLGIASPAGNMVQIMAIKTGSLGELIAPYEGVAYAIANHAHVISMSWGGGGYSDTYQTLFDLANSLGIVCVAAAGNDHVDTPMYPASYDHVISVAATDSNNQLAYFSNYGNTIDIAAPGVDIISCIADNNNAYGLKSGTSMACPYVSSVCALMLCQNPALSPDEVLSCIQNSATDISALNPAYIGQMGAGLIDVAGVFECLLVPPIADFLFYDAVYCPNQPIQFTSQSAGYQITNWQWTFEGGTPATSILQNPTVSFTTLGSHTVTLTVTNVYGSNTNTQTVMVGSASAILSGGDGSLLTPGTNVSLIINYNGLLPYNCVYTDGTNNYTLSNINQTPYTFVITATTDATYTLVNLNSNCPVSISGQAIIDVFQVGNNSDLCECVLNRSIINKGFEQPIVPPSGLAFFEAANGPNPAVPGWQCTDALPFSGITYPIEFWAYGFNGVSAIEGNQFVEINAVNFNRLYQNVCLINGEQISWHYYHRGRAGVDVMQFRLYDTNNNLVQVLDTASTGLAWQAYNGSAVFTGTTGLYQLSFEAISTATGSPAIGNFVDDVEISLSPIISFTNNISSDIEIIGGNLPILIINGVVPAPGITVFISVIGGTATNGIDYTLPASVFIPAGTYDGTANTAITIPILVIDDNLIEANETIIIEVSDIQPEQFQLSEVCWENNVLYTIIDDDIAPNPCIINATITGNSTICIGQTTALTASGGISYQWSTGSNVATIVADIAGDYTVTVSDAGGCTDTATFNVWLAPQPVVLPLQIDTTICSNATLIMPISNLTPISDYSYAWFPIIELSCTDCPNPILTTNQSATYTLTITNSYGCSNTQTFTVNVNNNNAITDTLTQTSCNSADVGTVTNTFVAMNGCDSTVTVITTLLPSITDTLNQTSCNPADVGTVTNTFLAMNGCDSTVTVITTLLPSITDTLNQTSCNPADVGTVTNTFLAMNGCDSTITVITTLLPSITDTLNQTSCNPANVGTVTTIFVAMNGCDSTVTVITTLLPSITDTLNQTSCNPADVGTVTNTFLAMNGCDSTVTVITTLLPSITDTLNQTSCNPADVGTVTNTFLAMNGCDSTITVITTLLPSITDTLNQTSCNPANVGTVTTIFVAMNGCDSTVTVITTLLPSITDTLNQTSCNPADVGTVTNTFLAMNGCDSTVTVITTLLPSSTNTLNQTTCNPANVGTVTNTFWAMNGCDSTVTVITTLLSAITDTLNQTTCNPANVGTVTNTFVAMNGCDSTVTVITTLLPSITDTLNQTSCNPADVGTVTNTFLAMNGCDSTVTVITTLLPSITDTLNQTSCNPADVGTVTNTFLAMNGCDSTITVITTLLPSITDTLNQTSCNPANVGTVTTIFVAMNGCDSTVTVITTLLPSITDTLNQTSCNPADVGTVTNTFLAMNGCDSTVTVITTLLPSITDTLNQTSCNPADVGTVTNTFLAMNGCDSTITVITTLLPSITDTLNQTSCNPANVGTVTTIFVAMNGCDSTVTVITTLLPSITDTLNQTSCNPADVGTVTNTFLAMNGCDSTVTVITTLLPSSTNTLNQTTCNPANVGTVTNTFWAMNGCDSTVTVITTLLSAITDTLNQTTCNPANVGTVTNTFLAMNGCDSTITVITTLLPSSTDTLTQTTCNPANVGTVTNTFLAMNGCDSTVTVITTLSDSYTQIINQTSCNPADVGTVINTFPSVWGCDSTVTIITTLIAPIDCNDNDCNTTDTYNDQTCQCDHTDILPPNCNDNNPNTLDTYNETSCECLHTELITLLLPNAFSPNNDGVNDFWGITGLGINTIYLSIYNRWGEKVFETHNPTDTWDGKYKGFNCEIGVYAYYLTGTFNNNETFVRKGNISLVR